MSYLDVPRLVFTGEFQADVSTINNDVRYYKNAAFQKKYQDLSITGDDGGWNPEGTGIFRFVGCRITGARLGDQQIVSPAQDPVIDMALENADDRVFGKIVDLDPQQQMVSQVWGMRLRLDGDGAKALFAGDFLPVAFINLWRRQQTTVLLDQAMAAVYQSVLHNVVWSGQPRSKVLDALRAASANGFLSINFNLYGYGRDPSISRYTLGRVAGVIGPYASGEPKHFVVGRQMVAATPQRPTVPANGVYSFQCKVHEKERTVSADFGNCLQIVSAQGGFVNNGRFVLGVLKSETETVLSTVNASDVAILGDVDYLQPDWYKQTGGVQDFNYSDDPWTVANIGNRPLLLLTPQPNNSFKVVVQESLGGFYLRSDSFVCRLNPKATGSIDLCASKYGKPLQDTIQFSDTTGPMGGAGNQPLNPPVETPEIATPADAIRYPNELPCDSRGRATLNVTVDLNQQPNPRGYIDGQLYGIAYQLKSQPAQTISNFWNFISVLAFSPFQAPSAPTWFADIQPILTQYGNLYPIMSKHLVDLSDYDSVVRHLEILRLAFSLPVDDPNHMPVTRDLSHAKRDMILQWMDTPGADGLPLKGTQVQVATPAPLRVAPEPAALALDPLQTRGKSEVMLRFEARQNEARQNRDRS